MKNAILSILVCSVLVSACASAPPAKSKRLLPHKEFQEGSGTLLVVDVCLRSDTIGDDDYFVIRNSQEAAQALLAASSEFFAATGIPIDDKIVPFVCGALHANDNSLRRAATTIGGKVEQQKPPFAVDPGWTGDAEYMAAMQYLGMVANRKNRYFFDTVENSNPFPEGEAEEKTTEPAAAAPPAPLPIEKVKASALLVAERSHRANLIYVEVVGNSHSTSKAAIANAAKIIAGSVFTVMTGVVPFMSMNDDIRQMSVGLVNLRTGELVRTATVFAGGDPMKKEVAADPDALKQLLVHAAYSNVSD